MNNYVDKYGRYHDKPSTGEPSSNNGWIYTAYAQKVGLPVDMQKLGDCFNQCRVDNGTDIVLIRSPGKANPPMSRDEILGMAALGVLKPKTGVTQGWNFSPFPIPAFNLKTLLKQLYELRPTFVHEPLFSPPKTTSYYKLWYILRFLGIGYYICFKHRNYFWQNNLDQLYRFAFSVPLQDRYFLLKCWGTFSWKKPSHVFYRAVAKIDSLFGKSGIKFLKYTNDPMKSTDAHSRGLLLAMIKEFPADHPIVQAVNGEI